MGCNLCSLQKREEHYKLLYEISQVNGRDLSRASHEEAAEALRSAKDPIVVQVLRRTPRPRGQGSVQDVCTQTEITFEHIMALAKLRPVSPPVPDLCPFLLSDSAADADEVELRRVSRQEKLGLTLCYRTDDEEDSAIYISEEEPWLDDEHSEFLEELKMEMLEEQRREEEEETKRAAREEEEEETKREAREEEEEARQTQDESITASCSYNHQKIIDPTAASEKSVLAQIQKKLSRCLHQSSASGRSGEEKDERCRQLLELKCQIRNSGEYDLFYARSSTIECSLTEPSGVERELRMLNEELRSIQMECQNIMKAHQLGSRKLVDISEHPEKSDKDSSSAYNTAESSRSTPLTMDRSPERRRVSLTSQKNLLALRRVPSGSPDHSNPSESEQTPPEGSHSRIPARCQRPVDDPVHARQHQSYVQLIQQQSAVEFTLSGPQVARPSEPKMEWKVKVRSDGTRYITKRPVRDRLLRERALKIKEERSGGMTTDDDAMSEMKMGRYWSKEERKQHLLRAKEQRRRREFMQRSRLESLRENPLSNGEGII
ncbi:PDZ domain-containing RING finger protein 4-like [Sinocyclocheilus grahami]|uniref:PDZ domain-containing RING finger protein 4-like n=1 Tax=Sinocyclocheilus grahami TaxID=75366 RepID=UPI0007AD0233|nr:PREDICTED: PDZ domain-containing RING finger protein 4-like [Sinocyclocheilus grahami]